MSLIINHNMMAMNAARNLTTHHRSLATSVRRLSSGLRVSQAADDAAGLAIRELMRADIAALNQGVRNANDAVSLIQTADGALQVIDEKLIRMKELAEQAATGTYDSTQRLLIDNEFQQMKAEIERIARSTTFNGIKLLCDDPEGKTLVSPAKLGGVDSSTGLNVLGPSTPIIEVLNPDAFIYDGSFDISRGLTVISSNNPAVNDWGWALDYNPANDHYVEATITCTGSNTWSVTSDIPVVGITQVVVNSIPKLEIEFASGRYVYIPTAQINTPGTSIRFGASNYAVIANKGPYENATITDITQLGDIYGSCEVDLDGDGIPDVRITNISGSGDVIRMHLGRSKPDEYGVTVHFGPNNVEEEDFYTVTAQDCTTRALGISNTSIHTQNGAQQALGTINNAIVHKDGVRAYYGAMQNRLENTITNISIQAENLQAAESRISDTDVSTEMTQFVRRQLLTQASVSMLAQANSMPHMALSLIQA